MNDGARRKTELVWLEHQGFRNLAAARFAPNPRFNVIAGDNGEGKSNLLEALHYLLSLESFRTHDSGLLIAHDQASTLLAGQVRATPLDSQYRLTLQRQGTRNLSLDGKRPRALRDWIVRAPTVTFHPAELTLASGSPGERRDFLDRILRMVDATYSDVLRSYQEALRSRNRLLKDDGADVRAIRAYDPLLAASGAVLMQARASLVEKLQPIAERTFAEVMGRDLGLTLRYCPDIETMTPDAILRALDDAWPRDQQRASTKHGPHADELELLLSRHERMLGVARDFASQGQQRLMVLALKLAELDLLSDATGSIPIVLLDDVSSELDEQRRTRLFERLYGLGGQVFLTTTHADFIRFDGPRSDFLVHGGALSEAAVAR